MHLNLHLDVSISFLEKQASKHSMRPINVQE